jgi:hypothetical protein
MARSVIGTSSTKAREWAIGSAPFFTASNMCWSGRRTALARTYNVGYMTISRLKPQHAAA